MKSAGFRRTSAFIFLLISFICYLLWKRSGKEQYVAVPEIRYKVRAYTPVKKDVKKILAIGNEAGIKGQSSKTVRTIKKLMGYEVVQDFKLTKGSPHASYIIEFLTSRGFSPVVVKREKEQIQIRVNGFFSDEKQAMELSSKILQKTGVSFEVRKHVRNSPYKAFLVVFNEIPRKETADNLKDRVSVITSDVEMVTY